MAREYLCTVFQLKRSRRASWIRSLRLVEKDNLTLGVIETYFCERNLLKLNCVDSCSHTCLLAMCKVWYLCVRWAKLKLHLRKYEFNMLFCRLLKPTITCAAGTFLWMDKAISLICTQLDLVLYGCFPTNTSRECTHIHGLSLVRYKDGRKGGGGGGGGGGKGVGAHTVFEIKC